MSSSCSVKKACCPLQFAASEQEAQLLITKLGFDCKLRSLAIMTAFAAGECTAPSKPKERPDLKECADKPAWIYDQSDSTHSLQQIAQSIKAPARRDGVWHMVCFAAGNDVVPIQAAEQQQAHKQWHEISVQMPVWIQQFFAAHEKYAQLPAYQQLKPKLQELEKKAAQAKHCNEFLPHIQRAMMQFMSEVPDGDREALRKDMCTQRRQVTKKLLSEGTLANYAQMYMQKCMEGPLKNLFQCNGANECPLSDSGKQHFEALRQVLEATRKAYEGTQYRIHVHGLLNFAKEPFSLTPPGTCAAPEPCPICVYNEGLTKLAKELDPSGEQIRVICCASSEVGE